MIQFGEAVEKMDYYLNDEQILIEQQKKVRQDIASQYVKARKEKHLTQQELADKLHVKRPNISRFESGEYNPTIDMLVKMAECLGMDLVVELKLSEED